MDSCTAVVVAAAPVGGAVSKGFLQDGYDGKKGQAALTAFKASAEYAQMQKTLVFCRLWCIGALVLLPFSGYNTMTGVPLPTPALFFAFTRGTKQGCKTYGPPLMCVLFL
jgi:hypothetical protein